MPKLKVLHISPTYFSKDSVLGGAERYVQGLASEMGKVAQVTLLSFGTKSFSEDREFYQFLVRKPIFFMDNSLLNPVSLGFLHEVAKHDVVHCHQIYTALTELTILAGRLLGKKVFLTDHGGGGRTFFRKFNLFQKASGVLAVSEYSLSKIGFNLIPGQAIYGGINSLFRVNSQIQKVPGRVLTVGRLLPHKGFHHLIRAITDQELILIYSSGSDEYLTFLKKLAQGKNITFRQNPQDQELIDLLNSAQLSVFPSTRFVPEGSSLSGEPELFGQAPLEAMACGTPALISNVGSYPEISLPHAAELLYEDGPLPDLKSKLEALRDPEKCYQLGRKAQSYASQRFNWQATVEKCLLAYQK